jgi:hypothetical protein
MLRMNQYQNIAGVTLGSVSDAKQGDVDYMQFSMTVQLKPNTAQDTITPGFDDTSSPAPSTPSPPLTDTGTQVSALTTPVFTGQTSSEGNHV